MADSHRVLTRAFIQIMLDRRFLPLPEVKTLVGALNQKYDYDLNLEAEEDLLDFISKCLRLEFFALDSLGSVACVHELHSSYELPYFRCIEPITRNFAFETVPGRGRREGTPSICAL